MYVMRWVKSRRKAAAVLGLGGLVVTGLGLADSAQAAGSHNIMVRTAGGWNVGSVTISLDRESGLPYRESRCTRVQNDIYNSTDFEVPEGIRVTVQTYLDADCRHPDWRLLDIDVPRDISTSNWWYTVQGPGMG